MATLAFNGLIEIRLRQAKKYLPKSYLQEYHIRVRLVT